MFLFTEYKPQISLAYLLLHVFTPHASSWMKQTIRGPLTKYVTRSTVNFVDRIIRCHCMFGLDWVRMLCPAGASRSSSRLLQWFKLEHCCRWQDGHPFWPKLSDHPPASSLWYTTQFQFIFSASVYDLTEYDLWHDLLWLHIWVNWSKHLRWLYDYWAPSLC